ncbi:MAG: hypothetical protein ACK55I_37195 [bacterium]
MRSRKSRTTPMSVMDEGGVPVAGVGGAAAGAAVVLAWISTNVVGMAASSASRVERMLGLLVGIVAPREVLNSGTK